MDQQRSADDFSHDFWQSMDGPAGLNHESLYSLGIQEHQLVSAWRHPNIPPDRVESRELAVVHRIHRQDETVTVQFLKDQHRLRLHVGAVTPVDKTPHSYPAQWIRPSEPMPTAKQCQEMAGVEEARRLQLERMGHPVPPRFNQKDLDLPPKRVEMSDRWGIPGPTLIALRNRSVPMTEVTGAYDQHFYTKLYEHNFYANNLVRVDDKSKGDNTTVHHIYVPLDGHPKEQMKDGGWRELPPGENIPRC